MTSESVSTTTSDGAGTSSGTSRKARTIASRDAILEAFEGFRSEIDEHNDRRERLIKASRDVTILSKKVIFLLHRLVTASLEGARSSSSDPENPTSRPTASTSTSSAPSTSTSLSTASAFASAAAEGLAQLADVRALFAGMRDDLAGERFWRYQAQVSPGLQEYIEAFAFAYFLAHGGLVSYDEVEASLCDEDGAFFPLPMDEYLLGVSDLTGELMRFAITAISQRAGRAKAREVSDFVRNCKADFDGFTPYVRGLGKKQEVTSQSLMKIEEAAYAIAVRASEYAGSEEILEDIVERCVLEVRNRRRYEEVGETSVDYEEL